MPGSPPFLVGNYVKDTLLAAAAALVLSVLRLLPQNYASATGGFLARVLCMRLRASKTAYRNLGLAFPNMDYFEKRRIVKGMWDNLGRTFAEFPHLGSMPIDSPRCQILGVENFLRLKEAGRPVVFFAGHFANWEVIPHVFKHYDWQCGIVYRRSNNRPVDWLIQFLRGKTGLDFIPKGGDGAKQLISKLKEKESVIMLIDQKMNDGEEVAFFGMPAMTGTAAARLAIKFDALLVPIRVARVQKTSFEVEFLEPLTMQINPQLNDAENAKQVMLQVHHMFESWITANPEQWLWAHRRWGKMV